ncbi:hypothetical protein PTT_11077 [Pyrenophora teres f. teres 0-1]|uniref:Uncharacterized protein n=2 Tax=Pyrenophora teres f. teres TaxID=97479 RepID=E3RQR8_PYRTT|nr:hypothetical protein PTT_11077 [Pyrenophora teres f. teres 0-1]CAE7193832.1 hypothetical protein PTTW11_07828 [Pyrenophora teres f. teres]
MDKVKLTITPVAAKITSLLPTKKDASPVFNKPVNTNSCPHHRMSRLLYSIFLTMLFAISITVVTFKAKSYSFIEDNRMTGFDFQMSEGAGQPAQEIVVATLPRRMYAIPAKLTIISAAMSILIAAAHLGFVVTDWKKGDRTQSHVFRRNIMMFHIINAIVVLFALVSIYVTHVNSSHFRDNYINILASQRNATQTYVRYDAGIFDVETWTCQLQRAQGVGMVQNDYGKQCADEIAGRAVMIPFMLLAWLIAGVGIWGFTKGGRRGPDGEAIRTQEVGLEMNKMNATDE